MRKTMLKRTQHNNSQKSRAAGGSEEMVAEWRNVIILERTGTRHKHTEIKEIKSAAAGPASSVSVKHTSLSLSLFFFQQSNQCSKVKK